MTTPNKVSVYMTELDRDAVRVLERRWNVGMAEAIRRAVQQAIEGSEQ